MKGMDWNYITEERVINNLNILSMELIRGMIEQEGAGDQIRGMLKLIDAVNKSMEADDD